MASIRTSRVQRPRLCAAHSFDLPEGLFELGFRSGESKEAEVDKLAASLLYEILHPLSLVGREEEVVHHHHLPGERRLGASAFSR
jgi:hypothetical protein